MTADRNALDAFLALRPSPAERRGELAAALEARLDEAAHAYPELELPRERLARRLAEVIDPRDEPLAALELLRPGPLFLALACAEGNPRAISRFDRDHISRIPAYTSRFDRSAAFADEVAQALRTHLFVAAPGEPAGILDYSGRGELDGWLRVLALRAASRLRRQQPRAEGELPELLGPGDPERDHLKLRYRGQYQAALQAALASLPLRERLLLKLHYLDGLNIDALGEMYQLHRSTVARRLAEHRRRLLELAREELKKQLLISDDEFESILRAVRSELRISLRGALKT